MDVVVDLEQAGAAVVLRPRVVVALAIGDPQRLFLEVVGPHVTDDLLDLGRRRAVPAAPSSAPRSSPAARSSPAPSSRSCGCRSGGRRRGRGWCRGRRRGGRRRRAAGAGRQAHLRAGVQRGVWRGVVELEQLVELEPGGVGDAQPVVTGHRSRKDWRTAPSPPRRRPRECPTNRRRWSRRNQPAQPHPRAGRSCCRGRSGSRRSPR